MKEIFTREFFARILIDVILLGFVVVYFQQYIANKWAPLTAEETLKRENFLNAKRDAYFQVIEILNRALANTEFIQNGKLFDATRRNRGGTYPTEVEVNSCFSKLCLYSTNKDILSAYRKLFDTNDSQLKPVLQMGLLVNLLRKDLGYDNAVADPTQNEYQFIQIHRRNVQ